VKFSFFKPNPPHRRTKVLFVDADGASLSVMACAFAHSTVPSLVVESAGIHPQSLRAEVRSALAEKNLVGEADGRAVATRIRDGFDTVVTLGAGAALGCPDFGPGVDRLHWGVDDPLDASNEASAAAYAKVRDELERRVRVFFAQK
jgi:protein-tyrosine-phosphatase